jgi:uncharacterized membrane protein YeaQ/YmgE (transglycosylase-associated protein family)
MDLVGLIVQIIAGALGGLATGRAVKSVDLGNMGNIIAGIVGGVGGSTIAGLIPGLAVLSSFAGAPAGVDIGALLAQGLGGLIGGGILTAIVGAVRNARAKSAA